MPYKGRSLTRYYQIIGLCFLLPAVLFYLVFMAYPLTQTVRQSFTNWTSFGSYDYIGLSNYAEILNDTTLKRALLNTVYFAFFASAFSVILGILAAWCLMHLRNMESRVIRTVLFTPNMISPTITGLLFLFVFTEDIGLLNGILRSVGLGMLANDWLTDPATVPNVIVVATVWRQFGLVMVLCFAGLQSIPDSLIEAAWLDGAGHWTIFRRILIPLIRPQIELSAMFTMLGGLKIFDSVVSLTGGGPARLTVVLPLWIIENAFTYSKFGYASAMCVVFVGVVFVFMIGLKLLFRGESYEY